MKRVFNKNGQQIEISSKTPTIVYVGDKKYYSRNYPEALKKLVPSFYYDDEEASDGLGIRYPDQLINSHLVACRNFSSLVAVSSPSEGNFSDINSASGFSKLFIQQNNLTYISPFSFQTKILSPLGVFLDNFNTKEDFLAYLESTLLPKIFQDPTGATDYVTTTSGVFASSTSGTHIYLYENLGWFFVLNTSSNATVQPSSIVASALTDTIFFGKNLDFSDGIKAFQKYLFLNYSTFSSIPGIYIDAFTSGTEQYTSGTQNLEKLNTLIDISYSPTYGNATDTYIRDSFNLYLGNGSIETKHTQGPLSKFLEVFSYGLAQLDNERSELEILYDIEKCNKEHIPLLAELIGWKLLGNDPDRWRLQLRNAVNIYKQIGTKKSIQLTFDTLFAEDNFSVVDTNLFSLWESYLPYLIWYSIITESPAVESFSSWKKDIAAKLGVIGYSTFSMEENTKYIVDSILVDLVRKFPDNFFVGNKKFESPKFLLEGTLKEWNGGIVVEGGEYFTDVPDGFQKIKLDFVPSDNFIFNYRGINYPIPPFEQFKYYKDCSISKELVDYLGSKLRCFGISDSFISKFKDYIIKNTIENTSEDSYDSKFLFFTSGVQYAPNYDEVLFRLKNVKYLSLWNGKSSTFRMVFQTSGFNFTKVSFGPDSIYAIQNVIRVLDEVAPANAIPKVILAGAITDDTVSGVSLVPQIALRLIPSDFVTASSNLNNFGSSAVNMSVGANSFSRKEVSSPTNPLLSSTAVISAPRNSLRRRNFKNLFERYTGSNRSGFSMPGNVELSSQGFILSTGYIPLGLNPSTLTFTPIPLSSVGKNEYIDASAFPPVYEICQNSNSSSIFYNVPVSNTFPIRGITFLSSTSAITSLRRNNSPNILNFLFDLRERRFRLQAENIYAKYFSNGEYNYNATDTNLNPSTLALWDQSININLITSWANQISNNTEVPFSYYENFEFGEPLHRLYNIYKKEFLRHAIYVESINGLDILNHIFDSAIYNYDFNIAGSGIAVSSFLLASSFDSEVPIGFNKGLGILSFAGSDVGTFVASSASDVVIGALEFRNIDLIDGVTLVDTFSVASYNNKSFSLFKPTTDIFEESPFGNDLVDRTLIKMTRSSPLGLPRIQFPIASGVSERSSILLPESDYSLSILAANVASNGLFGGQRLGVLIRTKFEQGGYWYLSSEGIWKQYVIPGLGIINPQVVFNSQSQIYQFPVKNLNVSIQQEAQVGITNTFCYSSIVNPNNLAAVQVNFNQAFENILINFNTKNKNVEINNGYFSNYGNVHRKNQEYIIELFLIDIDTTKYVLFDKVNLINNTLKEKAIIKVEEGTIKLTKSDLFTIFNYFNEIADGNATRNSIISSGVFEVSGGSRMNYRSNSSMFTPTVNAFTQITEINILES